MPKYARRSAVDDDLFVVRVRREKTSRETLRGYVDRIATGERFYFTTVDDLNAFLASRLSRENPERTT